MYKTCVLILFVVLVSCKNDKPSISPLSIYGNWQIKQATKNGQIFEAVAGGYFDFKKESTFHTNIPGLPSGSPFTLDGNHIKFVNDTISYNISSINDSLLVIESFIRNTPFQFTCIKK